MKATGCTNSVKFISAHPMFREPVGQTQEEFEQLAGLRQFSRLLGGYDA
jgi:hypothetical protein